jgi:hypothetical protein
VHRTTAASSFIPRAGIAVLLACFMPACSGCGEDPPGMGTPRDAGETIVDTGVDPERDGGEDPNRDGGPVPDGGEVDGGNRDGGNTRDGGANPNNPNNDMIDSDCDGLSDAQEFSIVYPNGMQTDPNDPDTDNDGIPDGIERGVTMAVPGSGCPPIADADPATTTSPVNADSDGDMIPDGLEDLDQNGRLDADESNPRAVDTDGDGLPDNIEDANLDGIRDANETHPARRDTDGDLISDGLEDTNRNGMREPTETDPLVVDTDGDTLGDGEEDTNHNGMTEVFETNPLDPDTDCDGLSDGDELNVYMTSPLVPDTDGDGVSDGVELGVVMGVPGSACMGVPFDQDPTTVTDPLDMDTDGDGLADGVEDGNMNGLFEPGLGETDPNDDDTDNDMISDGDEVLAGFDPLDPNDPPAGSAPGINAICSTANLKQVNFDVGSSWTLASELSFTYSAITTAPASANVDVAAVDDTTANISGFVLRMPLLAGAATIQAQSAAIESQLQAAAGAENLSYAQRISGRIITSHDGYDTNVSNVVDLSVTTGTQNAAQVRNAMVRMFTGLPGASFTGLPTATGAPTNQHTFTYQVLLRSMPQELIVVVGGMDRTTYDDVTNNAAIFIQDLTNGTALALANAERDKDCDPFTAAGQSVADFIWMADISGSTDDDRGRIFTAANSIVAALSANNVDFRMGVVPHSENDYNQGAGNGGDLRGAGFVRDPNLFASYLQDTSGSDGCEFGLEAADNAIAKALPRSAAGVEQPRRLRSDAVLAVVYISDEYPQELTMQSAQNCFGYNPTCNTGVGDYYVTNNNNTCSTVPNTAQQNCIDTLLTPYINTITNNNGVAFAQVIPVGTPTVCTGYGCGGPLDQPANEPGRGYLDVVQATMGASYSPCNNSPGQALQAIIDAVAGAASQYTLSGPPISSTIRVGVVPQGSMTVTTVPRDRDNGFDYDPASNSIFFRGFNFRPAQGDLVVISYRNWQPPDDPCGPCQVGQNCDPQLGICVCDQAICNACGANQECDADCNCVCAPDCNGNCGPNEVCNPNTCACECAPDCGGACGNGTVCNQGTCTCECDPTCGGQCTGNLNCNSTTCNCECPTDCGGACQGNTICNSSTCDCTCDPTCNDSCPGLSVCDPTMDCSCICPTDCGGCPDGTMCNASSCTCECDPTCDSACENNEVCDPNNSCQCVCPADCGGCAPNETCDFADCRCVPIV